MEEGECPSGIGRSDTRQIQVGPRSITQEDPSASKKYLVSTVTQTNGSTVVPSVQYGIDIYTVKSVAARHPRFAATLAQLRYHRMIQKGSYIVHWTPVEITLSDVEKWLNQKGNDDYFRAFNQRCLDLNKLIQMGQLEEIVYYLTIENRSPSACIIRIRVADEHSISPMDPSYSALEIRIPYANNAVGEPVKGISLTWQLKSGNAFEESPSRPNS